MNAAIFDECRLFAKTADGKWWFVGQKSISNDEFGTRYYYELGSEFRKYTDFFGTEIYSGDVQCETDEPGAEVSVEYRDAHLVDWDNKDLQKYLSQDNCFMAMHIRDLLRGYLPTSEQIVEFQVVQYHTGSGYHASSCSFPKIVSITAESIEEVRGSKFSIPDLPERDENRIFNLFAELKCGEIIEIDCGDVTTELCDISDIKWIAGRLNYQYGIATAKRFYLAIERYGKEIPAAFQPVILIIQP